MHTHHAEMILNNSPHIIHYTYQLLYTKHDDVMSIVFLL